MIKFGFGNMVAGGGLALTAYSMSDSDWSLSLLTLNRMAVLADGPEPSTILKSGCGVQSDGNRQMMWPAYLFYFEIMIILLNHP